MRVAVLGLACVAGAASADEYYVLQSGGNGHGVHRGELGSNVVQLVTALESDFWSDLAGGTNSVYAIESLNEPTILNISIEDGEILSSTPISGDVRSIARDNTTSTLYGTSKVHQPNELFTIDLETGVATTIGSLAIFDVIRGLGFDEVTGHLFAATQAGDLYEIDPATADSTLIGSFGFSHHFMDIAYNPADGEMYIVDGLNGFLYSIDREDASLELINSIQPNALEGLAFVPAPGAGVVVGCAMLLATRRRR